MPSFAPYQTASGQTATGSGPGGITFAGGPQPSAGNVSTTVTTAPGITTTPNTGTVTPPAQTSAPVAPPPVTTPASINNTQPNLADATATYNTDRANDQAIRDAGTEKITDSINKIQQGTFPLTPAQQGLMDGVKQGYNSVIQQQATANANYTGGTTVAQERMGLSRYAPMMAQANIQQAVSVGLSKIADIEGKMSTALGDLQKGFDTQNIALVKDSYSALTANADAKDKVIKDTYDAVQAQIKDHLTQVSANTLSTALSTLNDPKLSDTQKQQAVSQALASGSLSAADAEKLNTSINEKATQSLAVQKYQLDVNNSAVDNQLKTAQAAKIYNDMKAADIAAASSWVTNIKNGTAKFSDVPKNLKDAVSVGLANSGTGTVSDILQTTKTSLDELNALVNKPGGVFGTGFTGAVGQSLSKSLPGLGILKKTPEGVFAGTAAADFIAKVNQVKNDVVLPNLTILHGLGRVTDREFQALTSAVTSLNINTTPDAFKLELKNITDRIDEKMSEVTTHNGVTLPSSAPSGAGAFQGITLPN